MLRKIFYALTVFFILLSSTTFAQNRSSDNSKNQHNLEYRKFRLSLFPPLSTNGIDATNYASKYSLNLLAGYNGALKSGYELGIWVNANKYYAEGVQVAGLLNYSGEQTTGIQLAGLGNVSGEEMTGIQLSGIGNISGGTMEGIQLSGILNLSGGYSTGLQAAGIINASRNGIEGLMASGIGNISGGSIQGLLASGFFNIAKNDMQGLIFSGIVNYSRSFQGISASSINVSEDFQGIQIGSINVADYGEGIQLGVINYVKDFEGVPVGVISYYENGRTNLDMWASDGGFTNVGLKLGTHEIYNMISIGYNPLLSGDVWQLGWSIGRLHEYTNHFLYTDFSYFKINKGGWTKDLNSNFKYRLLFGKELANGVKFYGGPTINMLISRVDGHNRYTWYRLFDFGAKGREYVFWAGFSMGFELF